MDRRRCITHSDNLFSPVKEIGISSDIAMLVPFVGFIIGLLAATLFGAF